MAVMLPFVLLLFDRFLNRKHNSVILVEKIPFFFVSGLFAFLAVRVQGRPLSVPFSFSGILGSLYHAGYNILFYISKTLVPIRLSCYYPFPFSDHPAAILVCSLLFFMFLAIAGLIFKRARRIMFFGMAFFGITILPVLNLIPFGLGIVSDRYTYLPLLGLFFIAGEGFSALFQRMSRSRIAGKIA
jgi:hypothetical protein